MLLKQYIPSKRHRFGITFYILYNCESGFIIEFLVYAGNECHIIMNNIILGSLASTLLKSYFKKKAHCIFRQLLYFAYTISIFIKKKKTGACGIVKSKS